MHLRVAVVTWKHHSTVALKMFSNKSINQPTDFPREDHLRINVWPRRHGARQLTPLDPNWRTSSLFSLPACLTRICTSSYMTGKGRYKAHIQYIGTLLPFQRPLFGASAGPNYYLCAVVETSKDVVDGMQDARPRVQGPPAYIDGDPSN